MYNKQEVWYSSLASGLPYFMKKVLLIDDEKEFFLLTKRAFEAFSIETDCAESAAIAIDMLGKEDYDAIVSDINMPDLSGIDFFHEIKSKGLLISPFIFLTGYNKMDYNFLLEQGVDRIFEKPPKFQEIAKYLEEYKEDQSI